MDKIRLQPYLPLGVTGDVRIVFCVAAKTQFQRVQGDTSVWRRTDRQQMAPPGSHAREGSHSTVRRGNTVGPRTHHHRAVVVSNPSWTSEGSTPLAVGFQTSHPSAFSMRLVDLINYVRLDDYFLFPKGMIGHGCPYHGVPQVVVGEGLTEGTVSGSLVRCGNPITFSVISNIVKCRHQTSGNAV